MIYSKINKLSQAIGPLFVLLAAATLLSSCATAKKKAQIDGDGGAASPKPSSSILPNRAEEKETLEELKAIANSDAAMIPVSTGGEEETEKVIEDTVSLPLSRGVLVGDIFSQQEGALEKEVSIADSLGEVSPARKMHFLDSISSSRETQVPMSIPQKELDELRSKHNDSSGSLPNKPLLVAFDSAISVIDKKNWENKIARASMGNLEEFRGNSQSGRSLQAQVSHLKKRIRSGEKLLVITKVTRSESALARYQPVSPLVEKDGEKISNLLALMFPLLDTLRSQKKGDDIELTQEGGMVWTFEASPLRMEANRIRVGSGVIRH